MSGERYQHIFLSGVPETSRYRAPRTGGGSCPVIPSRYRAQHSEYLRRRFDEAWLDRVKVGFIMSDLIRKHGGYRKLKSFQVARASLDKLKRQRGLAQWERENPLRQALIDRRCQTADEVADWVVETAKKSGTWGQNGQSKQKAETQPLSTGFTASTLSIKTYPEIFANAAPVLLAVACLLVDRQIERLAQDFEKEGGFTERLYKVRTTKQRSAL